MSQEIIFGLGILAVALTVALTAYFLINNRKAQQKRTLSIITGQPAGINTETVKDASDRRRAVLSKKLQQTADPTKEKKKGGLRERLNQAGLDTLPVKKFWIYSALFGVLMTFLCLAAGRKHLHFSDRHSFRRLLTSLG